MPTLGARHQASGFTLVEVLIAVVVVSIGTLALGSLQVALSRHADVARQRTEATQLAISKLEELRGFEQVLSEAGKQAYADLRSGSDQPLIDSNTRFERQWQVQGTADDPYLRVDVQVTWADRSGDTSQTRVGLGSLIARVEPADAGSLGLLQGDAAALLRPKGRALDIPIEAERLTGANRGRSVLRWRGASGGYLVFDEADGAVIAQCETAPDDRTDIAATCTPLQALLLRGDLSGSWAAAVTSLTFTATQHLLAVPDCHVADAVNHNDGRPIVGMRSYACLMRPGDHDTDAGTPRAWSGQSRIAPEPVGTQAVCRYTATPSTTLNEEHPALYTLVTRSLHHQNFLLLDAGACPAGTVLHQP
ncbi:type IV pilus modification PilV family protein [Methylibium sp.]|jgi:type IV pilus modification protein PilV|uniref:type IV pilus modification PilV family protein n=1 Tax=Methylibium sp. TaxID=2067992 RepID=UPI003D0E620A